jgi:hypothetical protein
MSAGGDGFFHGYASVRRALRSAFRQPPSRQVTAKTVSVNCGRRKDQQLPIGSRPETAKTVSVNRSRKDHPLNGNFQVGNRWSKP